MPGDSKLNCDETIVAFVDDSFVDPAVVTNDDANALGVIVVTPIVTCLGNMPSL